MKSIRIAISYFLLVFLVLETACSPSREQVAATMAVQTVVVGGTDTSLVPTTHTPIPKAVELFEQATSYSRQGEDEKAIEAYTKAIKADPLYGQPYINRGAIYGQYGETEKALADFNKGLELDPTNALGYSNRAQANIFLDNLDEALADIKSYLSLMDDEYSNKLALNLGGSVYEKQGETDLALAAYSAALEIDEFFSPALLHRGQIYLQQEDWLRAYSDLFLLSETTQWPEEQQVVLDLLMRVHPEDTNMEETDTPSDKYYTDSIVYNLQGDYERAVESLTKAIEIDPLNSVYYHFRGENYVMLGYLENAITDANYVIALNPFNPNGYFSRGYYKADYHVNLVAEAITDLEKAIELDLPSEDVAKANQLLESLRQQLETCQMTEFEVDNDAEIPTFAFTIEGPPGEQFVIFANTSGSAGSMIKGTIPEDGIAKTGTEYEMKEGETTTIELEITVMYENCRLRKTTTWPEIDILAILSGDDSATVGMPDQNKSQDETAPLPATPEPIATRIFNFFCSNNLPFCNSSRKQIAATMAVQTIEARATGTAGVEQAVSDALTKAAPTHTATSTATPMSTHTPTFTATPEVQQYFTEEFDGGLENWSAFREGYKTTIQWYEDGRAQNQFLLTGNRSVLPDENMQVEDGFLKFDNQEREIYYAIYEPFEYEEVRIDARFENKGSNETYVNLICNYTEDVGWYEIALSPNGTWYIGYAKVKGNDIIIHEKFHPFPKGHRQGGFPGESVNIMTDTGVNEFTAICRGDKITLFINGSLETEIDVSDFGFGAGKVGVAVRAHKKIPAKIDFDWVKISQP